RPPGPAAARVGDAEPRLARPAPDQAGQRVDGILVTRRDRPGFLPAPQVLLPQFRADDGRLPAGYPCRPAAEVEVLPAPAVRVVDAEQPGAEPGVEHEEQRPAAERRAAGRPGPGAVDPAQQRGGSLPGDVPLVRLRQDRAGHRVGLVPLPGVVRVSTVQPRVVLTADPALADVAEPRAAGAGELAVPAGGVRGLPVLADDVRLHLRER